MSGAETLAVIGIIANIVSLAKFSNDVVFQIKEYGENAHEVPKAFRDIQAVLPLLSSNIMRIRYQAESGILDDDTCKVLKPVLEGCENNLKRLRLLFNGFLVKEGASKLRRGLMVIKSMRKYDEVEGIAQALDRFVVHLIHFHTSEEVTSKDVDSLRLATFSFSLEQPKAELSKTHFVVPVQWSDDFVGREEVMTYLESRLCLEDRYSRVALVGLGGLGKTRIALEYAKKFKDSNKISIFWVYAGTIERFKSAYHEIARNLNIPGHQNPGSDILKLVKEYLQDGRSGRWLIILDNVDDAELMYGPGSLRLANHLPISDQGSILLTTRFQKVGASFTSMRNVMSLQSMTLIESEQLLRARLNDDTPGQNDLYRGLAEELERTPLALVQAASFMSQNCIAPDSYLRMYRESDVSKIRLLSEDFEDGTRDSDAKNPIVTTWIISFDYIRTLFPEAAELLALISVIDAQNIPEFLIPQCEDLISFNKAIGILEAFSILSSRKKLPGSPQKYRAFDIHRLVRLAIRNWLKINNSLDQRTAQMLKILASRCAEIESEKFETSSLILPHVIELLASDLLQCKSLWSQNLQIQGPKRPSLSDLHSMPITTSTQFRNPIDLLESVDTIPNLVKYTAELLEYVTSIFRGIGNLEEARNFAAQSLAINRRACGQSHNRTLLSMRVYATILQYLGMYEHAEQLRRQKITICEAEYGFQHVLTLESLLELFSFLDDMNRKEEAQEIVEIMVPRCRKSLSLQKGKRYLDILSILAEIQQYNGKFEEAERCAVLTLHGHQAAKDDFETIIALDSLCRIYERQDKLGLAGDTKKTALDLCIRYYGDGHPTTTHTRWQLIIILLNDRQIDEARRQASLALKLISQVHDPSSDTYAHFYGEFDHVFSKRGQVLFAHEEFDATVVPPQKLKKDATSAKPLASHTS